MQRKGCKHLRIASILVILLGICAEICPCRDRGDLRDEYFQDHRRTDRTDYVQQEVSFYSCPGRAAFYHPACRVLPDRKQYCGDCDQHYPACDPLLLFP